MLSVGEDARVTLDSVTTSLPWRLLGVVGALVLVVYALTADYDGGHNDVHSANLEAWRIATTGSPWLDGVDIDAAGMPRELVWIGEADSGHQVVFRSPGVVAVAVPAYFISGEGISPHDFSNVPGALTAVGLATAALLLFLATVRPYLTRAGALTATATLAFATPMWTVAGDALWTHSVTTLGILGMAWACHRERWLLVGLFGGLALWGRLHTALIVAILGVGIAIARRRPAIAVAIGSVSAACMGLASVWSHWLYGTWMPTGGYPADAYASNSIHGTAQGVINHLGLWISPDRGVLVWSPVLVLLFPALVRGWKTIPDWTRWLAVGGLAYTLVQGQLNGFTGGSGYYGYRLTLELLVCIAPAYALTAHHAGRWARHLAGPVLGLQFAAMALGAIANALFVLEEDAWTDNSLWLGMRLIPVVNFWIVLMLFIGWLGAIAWRDRFTYASERELTTAGSAAR